jgi:hypothetical protein
MSTITGTVIELGEFGKRHGAKIKTAFGVVMVGRTKDCARTLARIEYFSSPVTVEVDDTDGRVLSAKAVQA